MWDRNTLLVQRTEGNTHLHLCGGRRQWVCGGGGYVGAPVYVCVGEGARLWGGGPLYACVCVCVCVCVCP